MDESIGTAIGLVLCFILLGLLGAAFILIARNASRQKRAYGQVDESVDISRHSLELSERAVALTEKLVRNQEEMIRLLREIAGGDGANAGDGGRGAVQLSNGGRPGQQG